jgi:hypothetical protein
MSSKEDQDMGCFLRPSEESLTKSFSATSGTIRYCPPLSKYTETQIQKWLKVWFQTILVFLPGIPSIYPESHDVSKIME